MQNNIYSLKNLIASKTVSFFVSPYYGFLNMFRKDFSLQDMKIKKILITEYHRIGDLIIIIPLLKSIKKLFPNAKIILLCNESIEQLAKHLKLADKIIGVSFPWTSWSFFDRRWKEVFALSDMLSKEKIDLAFDFKGDLRNSWFIWTTKPKKSFGYSTTGGSFFFTDAFFMDQQLHQFSRSEKLIKKAGFSISDSPHVLTSNRNGTIVIHPGASDSRRQWPNSYWLKLVEKLSHDYIVSIVKTDESLKLISQIKKESLRVEIFEGDIIKLMYWFAKQKILIAPDSMAGHLASYVGLPVISLFGSQNPNLTKPKNKYGKIIKPTKVCSHVRDHWRLCRLCIESISPRSVYKEVLDHILHIESIL